jgi:hypothetical protein
MNVQTCQSPPLPRKPYVAVAILCISSSARVPAPIARAPDVELCTARAALKHAIAAAVPTRAVYYFIPRSSMHSLHSIVSGWFGSSEDETAQLFGPHGELLDEAGQPLLESNPQPDHLRVPISPSRAASHFAACAAAA